MMAITISNSINVKPFCFLNIIETSFLSIGLITPFQIVTFLNPVV
jgi:hypothetical protein